MGIVILLSLAIFVPLLCIRKYMISNNFVWIIFKKYSITLQQLDSLIFPFALSAMCLLFTFPVLFFFEYKILRILAIVIVASFLTLSNFNMIFVKMLNYYEAEFVTYETNFENNIIVCEQFNGFWICENTNNDSYVHHLTFETAYKHTIILENYDNGICVSFSNGGHSRIYRYFEFKEGHFVSVSNL